MPYPEFTTEELSSEEWRPVVGYEEHYAISSLGRVKRIAGSRGLLRRNKEHVMSPHITWHGYLQVTLCRGNEKTHPQVHTLVAAAFIGPRPEAYQVNHIDGDKTHSAPENLEYVTAGDNMRHAFNVLKVHPRGSKTAMAKLTDELVLDLRRQRSEGVRLNYREIAEQAGTTYNAVRLAVQGKTWRHLPLIEDMNTD